MKNTSRTLLKWLLVLGLLGCVWVVIHGSGSKTTLERYRAGLRARGEKLTLAGIAIPPSTNPMHIAARQTLDSSAVPPLLFRFDNVMIYSAPGTARVDWRGTLNVGVDPARTNAVAPSWEDFSHVMGQAETSLDVLRGALENPPPDTGWVWQDNYQSITNNAIRNLGRVRIICQLLEDAAMADLHEQRLDAAITNLHALAGLAQLNRNEPTMVSQMIRITVARVGLSITWNALQAPGWDEPRLAALQSDWEHVEFMDGLERLFLGQRAFNEVIMAHVRTASLPEFNRLLAGLGGTRNVSGTNAGGAAVGFLKSVWWDQLAPLGYKLTAINEDELVQLQYSTRTIEAVRRLKTNRPWPEIQATLTTLDTELSSRFKADKYGRLIFSRLLLPLFMRGVRTGVETETQRKLTITAIAIRRHQLKHGVAPSGLAALVPEFLAAVPVDPMSGKPLGYRLKADGSFVLYSTGEDGKDDGGDPSPAGGNGKFGLWEGRDAVWPAAESAAEKGGEATLKGK